MMGYNKKSSKQSKQYLNFTPELSTRKSPCLLSKQLSATREHIANDHFGTDSELSPSQLSAFSFPVPADILLDNLSACWRRVPVSAK
jgi:hypothetical protein